LSLAKEHMGHSPERNFQLGTKHAPEPSLSLKKTSILQSKAGKYLIKNDNPIMKHLNILIK